MCCCYVDVLVVKDSLLVNVIVVVGHEKLNVEMQRTYGSTLTVVKIPKSGGVSSNVILSMFSQPPSYAGR